MPCYVTTYVYNCAINFKTNAIICITIDATPIKSNQYKYDFALDEISPNVLYEFLCINALNKKYQIIKLRANNNKIISVITFNVFIQIITSFILLNLLYCHISIFACLVTWQPIFTAIGRPAICVGYCSILTQSAVTVPPKP